jgi:hypothetical protein
VLRLEVAAMIGCILRRSLRKKVIGVADVSLGVVGIIMYSAISVDCHSDGSSFSAILIHFVSKAWF